jgi:DNA (cytosine-5)-methyltransferase 1
VELGAIARSGIGGGGKITAVKHDPEIAAIYATRFPNDEIMIADAFTFLEEHYLDYDFIWASPPCQSHSRLNKFRKAKILPDMRLYSIILFLKNNFPGKWVVENVVPYYQPLIPPTIYMDRHYFWSNFPISPIKFPRPKDGSIKDWGITDLAEFHQIDINLIKALPAWAQNHDRQRTVLRNCVDCRVGLYILKCALAPKQTTLAV